MLTSGEGSRRGTHPSHTATMALLFSIILPAFLLLRSSLSFVVPHSSPCASLLHSHVPSLYRPADAPQPSMTQLHLFNFGKKDRTEDQQSASPDEAIVMPRARARARSSDDADEGTRRRRPVKVGATSWYGPAVDRVNAYEAAKLNGGRIGASRVRGYRDKVAIEEVTWEKNQIIALETARREVPSGAFLYWDQIAERVPGKTATQCEDYVRTQLFNRAAGTNKNFFKEQIFVKEPEMKVRRRRRSSSSSAARESSSSDAGAAAAPFGFFAGLFGR